MSQASFVHLILHTCARGLAESAPLRFSLLPVFCRFFYVYKRNCVIKRLVCRGTRCLAVNDTEFAQPCPPPTQVTRWQKYLVTVADKTGWKEQSSVLVNHRALVSFVTNASSLATDIRELIIMQDKSNQGWNDMTKPGEEIRLKTDFCQP
ncbi:unnamed protein product [Protopolystoma xenopodis]|uniref:Uncharacterized protein n=1 Tax=Protopolystoma xenopodis TaxID=117903 RepID=A0A448X5H2_9PLAT|nr:unnamed protein product [Protopolystoma xenopodis]